nr:immunoglobulin heavy chain junction region [Macaca mulatta]MOV50141.1 immunoglobulin heavy chain junction region [Macaca mulatta]MOV50280.1 immunoglobulin heavy chain junction region [Macaca mulatta]MOV51308.1 immunoglobulin heavy chain junction region [Macaca mulatta]
CTRYFSDWDSLDVW